MKKSLIIISTIIIVFLVIGGTFTFIYNHSTDLYTSIKYKDGYNIETVALNNDNSNSLGISNSAYNYIKTTSVFGSYVITKGINPNPENVYTNGIAHLSFSINNKGQLNVKITSITDSNGNSYLDKLPEKEFNVSINGEKLKYITKDNQYIYLLTENGNLFVFEFDDIHHDPDTFSEDLKKIKQNRFYKEIKNNSVKEMFFYKENNESEYQYRLYVLLNNTSRINVLSGGTFEENESIAYFYRFGNASLLIMRDGTIKYCGSFQRENCNSSNIGQIIVDENNKKIEISSIFETTNSELIVIDTKKNIFYEKFDNRNHTVINHLNKLNNKTVEGYTYISKKKEPNILSELIVNYTNGTRSIFTRVNKKGIFIK